MEGYVLRLATITIQVFCILSAPVISNNANAAAILRYGNNGNFIDLFSHHSALVNQGFMTFSPSGDLYVSSFSFSNPVVHRIDGTSGDYNGIFAEGRLITAAGTAFGPNGNLFVGSQQGSVNEYDGTTGEYIQNFASNVDARGVVFGPDGDLYVSDASEDSIKRFDGVTGQFIDHFVSPNSGGLNFPQNLTFGPDGNLYVANTLSDNVLRYDGNSGDFLGIAAAVGNAQHDIAFSPEDQLLYVSDPVNDRILRYDGLTGTFIDEFITYSRGHPNTPAAIEFGTDGYLYVAEFTNSPVPPTAVPLPPTVWLMVTSLGLFVFGQIGYKRWIQQSNGVTHSPTPVNGTKKRSQNRMALA